MFIHNTQPFQLGEYFSGDENEVKIDANVARETDKQPLLSALVYVCGSISSSAGSALKKLLQTKIDIALIIASKTV